MNYNKLENNSSSQQSDNLSDNNISMQVEEIMDVLDVDSVIPDGLVDRVIDRKESFAVKNHFNFDFSKYLQIAVVFAAAISIGILMGKNADIASFRKNQDKKEKALIELRERYHLTNNDSFGRL
ncbi:hypothetical protein [uncultured Draconibacterium sp.]|uniref:hypothetical protein n=1 Tax=uncultured Draconibacterium sp. TaxID=1573823 RepID=UPI003216A5E9